MEQMNISPDIQETVLNVPESIQHELRQTLDASTISLITAAYVRSFATLYWVLSGLCLSCVVVSALFLRRISLIKDDDEEQRESAKQWLAEQMRLKQGLTEQQMAVIPTLGKDSPASSTTMRMVNAAESDIQVEKSDH